MPNPDIQTITAHQTHALRHRVLRPHQTLGEMTYPGDDDPTTIHLGAIDLTRGDTTDNAILGIISLYHQPMPNDPKPGDWRLRGMAVSPAHQNQGIGAALVAQAIATLAPHQAQRLWCNARTTAAGFYQHLGFTQAGKPFNLPGIGEHFVMHIAVDSIHR